MRDASCVDGPRLAKDHLACSAEVACSHVSGLLVQSGWTAGPDGVRDTPHAIGLLRARRERPSRRRAADERDEVATPHSITSSASAKSLSGMARPSALAVLRLITSSYLVG